MALSLLDDMDVRAVGDLLLFTSDDRDVLRMAMRQIFLEGGYVVQAPTRVGHKWHAAVLKPSIFETASPELSEPVNSSLTLQGNAACTK